MFFTKRIVRLSETDATGVIYFTNLLKFTTEALEEFLGSKGTTLFKLIQNSDYLLPIVSAKCEFLGPIFLSDEINLTIALIKMGTSSIEIHTEIKKETGLVGKVEMIHVVTSKKTMEKMPIPKEIKTLFNPIKVIGV